MLSIDIGILLTVSEGMFCIASSVNAKKVSVGKLESSEDCIPPKI